MALIIPKQYKLKLLPEKSKKNIRMLKSPHSHSGGLLPEIFFLKTLLKYGMDWDMQARVRLQLLTICFLTGVNRNMQHV